MTASVRSLVRKTGNSIVSICCCNIQGDRVGFVEYVSRTLSSTTSVTKIIFLIFINLVTPKVRAKHEPLFNKPASEHMPPLFFLYWHFDNDTTSLKLIYMDKNTGKADVLALAAWAIQQQTILFMFIWVQPYEQGHLQTMLWAIRTDILRMKIYF